MKELRKHPAAKITAVILAILFIAAGVLSIIGIYMCAQYGCYTGKPKEDILRDEYSLVLDRYSIQALSNYGGDFNRDKLDKTNFRYGVIESDYDSVKKMDLNDPSIYITRNFDKKVSEKDLHFFSYTIGEGTWFRVSDNYFNRENYIYTNDYSVGQGDEYVWVYEIYFIQDTKDIVFRCDNKMYKTKAYRANGSNGRLCFTSVNGEVEIPDRYAVFMDDAAAFKKETDHSLDDAEAIIPNIDTFDFDETETVYQMGMIVPADEQQPAEKVERTFTIVSFMNEPLKRQNSFVENDMFVWAADSVGFLYGIRFWLFVTLPLSFAIAAYLVYFLVTAAGHRRGTDEITRSVVDSIPQDLFAAGLIVYISGFIFFTDRLLAKLDLSNFQIVAYMITLAAVVGAILLMLFMMNFSTNVKLGKWWKHLFIYRFLALVGRGIKKVYNSIDKGARGTVNALLIWVAFLAVTIIEFILVRWYGDKMVLIIWTLGRICVAALIVTWLYQLSKLKSGCRTIREGDVESKIDTKGLIPDFKDIAEDVNSIGDGLNEAVEEKIKSERFRTELITNVSHDIKTPLTSIINYTDLLSREKIENENAEEYLEVLSRQSARLKKLIEDLIEASKASTGNLKMDMEKLNVGTLVGQAVAEYERKLGEKEITILTKSDEGECFVYADPRHLWRVFDNLLNNIYKYAMPGTRAYIDITKCAEDGAVIIAFKNTSREALNITEEELMERFVRGDSSRNTEGSGLGLSIARSLTELMNGSMNIHIDGDLFKASIAFPPVPEA